MSTYRQPLLFHRPLKMKAHKTVAGKTTMPRGGYLPCTLASFLAPYQLPGPRDRYRWTDDERTEGSR